MVSPRTAAECQPTSRAAPVTKDEQVAELYRQFECRFMRREYGACLPYLEQACSLKDSPRCSLNLGAVHHALMHCELARAHYLRYLDRAAYDAEASDAKSALDELMGACGPATAWPLGADAASASTPSGADYQPIIFPLQAAVPVVESGGRALSPVDADLDAGWSRRSLGWWLIGAGAASGVGALIAMAHSARSERDVEARAERYRGYGFADDPELYAIDQRGRRANTLAEVLGVTSGVLLGAGATLWVLSVGDDASLSASAGPAFFQLEGAF